MYIKLQAWCHNISHLESERKFSSIGRVAGYPIREHKVFAVAVHLKVARIVCFVGFFVDLLQTGHTSTGQRSGQLPSSYLREYGSIF